MSTSLVKAYQRFCKRYKPQPKKERRNHWGSKKLAGLRLRMKAKKPSPGQQSLWNEWTAPIDEIHQVARQFVLANALNPEIAALQFPDTT